MRALVMTDFGKQATVAELPTPQLAAPDGVLVRVQAASLTRMDQHLLAGAMAPHVEHVFPVVLGRDFAGVVEQVGPEAAGFAVGDRVLGMLDGFLMHEGTIAEYVSISTGRHLAHLPAGLDPVRGAALPMAGLAATGVVDAVAAEPGQRVLVVGAAGGIGGYAVQLVAARGAYVIAAGLPEDEAYLRGLGAAEVIDYRTDLAAVLRERHPGGLAALVDVGTEDPAAFLELTGLLASGGRAASTAMAADVAALNERGIQGTNVMADLAPIGTVERLAAEVADGTLQSPHITVVDLDDAAAAVEAMRHEHTRGKYVIRLGRSGA